MRQQVLNLGRELQKDSMRQVLIFSDITPNGAVVAEALARDIVANSLEPCTVVDIDPDMVPLLRDILSAEVANGL